MNAAGQASHQPLLQDSIDGFFQLITVVFLDSIVFFLTLGFCMLAPRIFVLAVKLLTRWTINAENQKALCFISGFFFALMHLFMTILFSVHDEEGSTPDAPSVFWAVMWSTGIVVGVEGGLLVATVIVLLGLQVVGV
ncbi:uncharacterized protein M437DRAFT_44152 [Aureobasidium melanogenum CBS 110374]|uniref:Uncharacterized protein n=1 Tax=Aureobasidium melanogenum (strain CBS 110374) TaxID=1043003 RepID=A0A074WPU8_AURM1|nr:uncharacterized protein M437DRAFT_44152 [Aureobasidium melanogenum CBS 110374]KEQ64496.1 hypothetical protein M437DRAFT_44152 [Aureobasidium melanogenum CBS 110374]